MQKISDYLENLFSLEGKTIVLTGASGYLGRYMAYGLANSGANLILMGSSERVDILAEKLNKETLSDMIIPKRMDFYDRDKLEKALNEINKQFEVDVLINNAYDLTQRTGFNTEKGRLENSDFSLWEQAFESGIYWAVLCSQVFGKNMAKRQKGSIINVSSMYGIVAPNPLLYQGKDFLNPATYSVMKSGIIGFTKYVASFWGRHGIRCNAIAPGPFSNVEDDSENSVSPEDDFIERLKERTVLGRIGRPEELVGAVVFLASEASSYVTGHTLVIDGGWTIV